jgi:hypothetical protein
MMYEREDQADALIEQLIRDKDPLIRYGGIYATALAYVGSSNNSAVRRLLHVAVSDVSDDVRRASVTCLGFVLFRTPVQVPKLVSLLSESFNPHVRQGALMATAMVLMQESEGRNPKVAQIREKILKLITDKHVTTMTKVRTMYLDERSFFLRMVDPAVYCVDGCDLSTRYSRCWWSQRCDLSSIAYGVRELRHCLPRVSLALILSLVGK